MNPSKQVDIPDFMANLDAMGGTAPTEVSHAEFMKEAAERAALVEAQLANCEALHTEALRLLAIANNAR